nr:MAG: 25.2 kDa tombusvirus replication protein [Plant tombusvirus-like associated RNA 1]
MSSSSTLIPLPCSRHPYLGGSRPPPARHLRYRTYQHSDSSLAEMSSSYGMKAASTIRGRSLAMCAGLTPRCFKYFAARRPTNILLLTLRAGRYPNSALIESRTSETALALLEGWIRPSCPILFRVQGRGSLRLLYLISEGCATPS